MRESNMPVALTIAGSDSGGEAGIQADLKTFVLLKVHGASAITCVTAQNRQTVSRMEPCSPALVRAQIEAAAGSMPLAAAKTGMLYSAAIVAEVASFFKQAPSLPLVVDPVMVSTSGRRLLQAGGLSVLRRDLLPLAMLVTPNVAEAEILLGRRIATVEDLRAAACAIFRRYGCAALAKGGHLRGTNEAVDFLYSSRGEWLLTTPRLPGGGWHGTGCTYSAAITAWLARGCSLEKAVDRAKNHIARSIYGSRETPTEACDLRSSV
ncbi:MAG: bifunctional hydroxymethylpyrimidine kinase/phosphomethylpyrimidine kinase [Limisphaerales bacterium]